MAIRDLVEYTLDDYLGEMEPTSSEETKNKLTLMEPLQLILLL